MFIKDQPAKTVDSTPESTSTKPGSEGRPIVEIDDLNGTKVKKTNSILEEKAKKIALIKDNKHESLVESRKKECKLCGRE